MRQVVVFLISLAVFFFEIVCARILGFSVGSGFELLVIGLAMLGICSAGSFVACFRPEFKLRPWMLPTLCASLGTSFLLLFAVNGRISSIVNTSVASYTTHVEQMTFVPVLGITMLIPYFLFGLLLSLIFRECKDREFSLVYFWDLLGGALGCAVAYFFLEYATFPALVTFPLACALGATAVLLWKPSPLPKTTAASLALVVTTTYLLAGHWEPAPNVDLLARNYDNKSKVEEVWKRWNSYSRLGLVRITPSGAPSTYKLQLGSGEGEARLGSYPPSGMPRLEFSRLTLALNPAPRTLVLMAGSGYDMLGIDKLSGSKADITGVELNPMMKEGALWLESANMETFYRKPNIHLVIDEARSYMERSRDKFDVILASFSGATHAYLSGTMGHTTQFVYTVEAMETMLSRLTPQGYLILVNTNKLRLLYNLKEAAKRKGSAVALRSQVMILGRPGRPQSTWYRAWDNNRLLIKPSGFTRREVNAIRAEGIKSGLRVLLSPFKDAPRAWSVYQVALNPFDNQVFQEGDFSPVTDNNPFILDIQSKGISWDRMRKILAGNPQSIGDWRILMALVLSGLSVFLILGPLLLKNSIRPEPAHIQHFLYFSVLGAGFMLIEIGMVHKMSLLLGPGLSLPLVLGGIVFFAGMGSLLSARLNDRVPIPMLVGLVVLLGAFFLGLADPWIHRALAFPLGARTVVALVLLAPLSLVLGFFMPAGLRIAGKQSSALIGWGWGINGVTGTIAACLSVPLATLFGFDTLIGFGLCLYAAIWLLPAYCRTSVPRGKRLSWTVLLRTCRRVGA